MITKTKFWETIRFQLKEFDRSKRFTAELMTKIRNTPQDAIKTTRSTAND